MVKRQSGRGEMACVDAGREGVDIGVAAALGLVEAEAAREHQVGPAEQLPLEVQQTRRGAAEGRQLVHVVVDGEVAAALAGEGQRHRRVVPEGPVLAPHPVEEAVEQGALGRDGLGGAAPLGQAGHRHRDAARAGRQVEDRVAAALDDRLFEHHDPVAGGRPGEQVLGPLPDEIPSQMREAEQQTLRAAGGIRVPGRPRGRAASGRPRRLGAQRGIGGVDLRGDVQRFGPFRRELRRTTMNAIHGAFIPPFPRALLRPGVSGEELPLDPPC